MAKEWKEREWKEITREERMANGGEVCKGNN
jgi:hypothetical protein